MILSGKWIHSLFTSHFSLYIDTILLFAEITWWMNQDGNYSQLRKVRIKSNRKSMQISEHYPSISRNIILKVLIVVKWGVKITGVNERNTFMFFIIFLINLLNKNKHFNGFAITYLIFLFCFNDEQITEELVCNQWYKFIVLLYNYL